MHVITFTECESPKRQRNFIVQVFHSKHNTGSISIHGQLKRYLRLHFVPGKEKDKVNAKFSVLACQCAPSILIKYSN